MSIGPNPLTHDQRLQIANEIAGQLTTYFGEHIIALALYGSVASGLDGPFSDIEMFCVIDDTNIDQTMEWCAGDWKAELNILSVNKILRKAAEINEKWPVVHNCYIKTLPLHDPTNLFLHVRKTALVQPENKFKIAIQNLIVGDIFEKIGKIRNIQASGDYSALPLLVANLAYDAACLAGLANRHVFSQKSKMLKDVQTLKNLPNGLWRLCEVVQSGDLSQTSRLVDICEAFWLGTIEWCQRQGFRMTSSLEESIARSPLRK